MVAQKAHTKRALRYGQLINIELVLDANGLATGVNNSYGEVDGSNNIVSVKGISPGVTGRDFSVNGSGLTFDPVTKLISANGSGTLRSTGAASVYDFLSYNAVYNNLRWSAFIVCRIGTSIMPSNVQYGLFGNNASASANKGACGYYTNNSSFESAWQTFVSRGTASNYLGRVSTPGAAPSNQLCVVTFVMDPTETEGNVLRVYVNDQALLGFIQLNNNNSPVTTPSFPLEFFGVGNGQLPMVGSIKKVILTSSATSYTNVLTTVRILMNEHNIIRTRTSDNLNTSFVPAMFSFDQDGDYKLSCVLSQDPTNPNRIFCAYTKGTSHLFNTSRRIAARISLNKAAEAVASFAASFVLYNPAGGEAVGDLGGGFDNNGVMHLFTDVNTSFTAGGYVAARHIYSSDLSTWSNDNITSSFAADGLLAARMYGNMIHVGGVWMKPYYKFTDEGNFTQSANYIFRSTDGINWTSVAVRAPGATYINEATVFWLGGNNVGYLARNESTLEWSLSLSSDLGLTWDAFTDAAFGETVTSANPPMVKSFMHNGVLIISAYIENRANDKAFIVYGKASDIVASRAAGFNLNTKICWWQTNSAPYHLHYGDIIHIDGTLKAVGAFAYDTFPPTGGLVNEMRIYTLPTWHVSKIETELGI